MFSNNSNIHTLFRAFKIFKPNRKLKDYDCRVSNCDTSIVESLCKPFFTVLYSLYLSCLEGSNDYILDMVTFQHEQVSLLSTSMKNNNCIFYHSSLIE